MRIIWLQLAVPVIALGLAWAATIINASVDSVYSQAAYERAENGWKTDNPEHVIAAYTIWLVVVTGFLALFTGALFVATFALFRTFMAEISDDNPNEFKGFRIGFSPFSIPPT